MLRERSTRRALQGLGRLLDAQHQQGAEIVHGKTVTPIEEGSLVLFYGDTWHRAIRRNGSVKLAGPVAVKTMESVGDCGSPTEYCCGSKCCEVPPDGGLGCQGSSCTDLNKCTDERRLKDEKAPKASKLPKGVKGSKAPKESKEPKAGKKSKDEMDGPVTGGACDEAEDCCLKEGFDRIECESMTCMYHPETGCNF